MLPIHLTTANGTNIMKKKKKASSVLYLFVPYLLPDLYFTCLGK